MIGHVDDSNRAMLPVPVRVTPSGKEHIVDAWVDTAFDGHFVFRSSLIGRLGLETLVETEAILADGSKVTLNTYVAYVKWFGAVIPVQVVENEGKFPLLGSAFLTGRRLLIDYAEGTLEIS